MVQSQTMDRFFQKVAARIAEAPGVVAVAVGGSWAREDADADSDVDFGVYYDPAKPPNLEILSGIAREVDDRHPAEPLTPIGGWGPWINGGGWLVIEGRRVDWIYRDLEKVAATIADCRSGRIASHYQPGHPHAFHTFIYAAEAHYGRPLFDPLGRLDAARRATAPYPAALREAILDRFLWEADFALRAAETSVRRGDRYHATGSFFRSVACVIQVLFAVNDRWFVNEKKSFEAASSLERTPPDFERFAGEVFSARRPPLSEELVRLSAVVEQTRLLAGI